MATVCLRPLCGLCVNFVGGSSVQGSGIGMRGQPLFCDFSPSRATTNSLKRRIVSAALEGDGVVKVTDPAAGQDHGLFPPGDWPENFSMLNYEDLSAHHEAVVFKNEAQPGTMLAGLMSRDLWTASPTDTLENVNHLFDQVSGLPVVDGSLQVVGILSKKDVLNSSEGLSAKVSGVMSSPAITITADKTVQEAAILMLKNKVHRIPVVNEVGQLVGMVTRTDIFTAMESKEE